MENEPTVILDMLATVFQKNQDSFGEDLRPYAMVGKMDLFEVDVEIRLVCENALASSIGGGSDFSAGAPVGEYMPSYMYCTYV